MKIYATGDGINLHNPDNSVHVELARIVGLIDLGSNNGDNSYGWSGVKAVANFHETLFLLDFLETVRLETNDSVLITEGDKCWWPTLAEAEKHDLYIFNLSSIK